MFDNDVQDPLIENRPFNEDEMYEYFQRKIEKADEELKDTWYKDLQLWENDWRDRKPKTTKPWTNARNTSSPVSSTATDALIPRLEDDLFGYAYPIDMQGDATIRGSEIENDARKLMKWDIDTHDDFQENMWHFIALACGLGTSFSYTFWDEEKEWVETEEQVDSMVVNGQLVTDDNGDPMPVDDSILNELQTQGIPFEVQSQMVKKKEWKWKRYCPRTITLKNTEVKFPSWAESLQDAFEHDFVAIEKWMTLDEIMRELSQGENKSQLYKNVDAIKAKEFAQANTQDDIRKLAKTKKIKFWLGFGRYDVDSDGMEEQVTFLIHPGSKKGLGWEKFPYKHGECPIVEGKIYPIHGRVIGIGIPEMLYDLKSYLDASRNQRLNLRDLYLDPVIMHKKNSMFDPSTMKFGTGQHWEVDFDMIKVLEINAFDSSQINDEQEVKIEIDKRLGFSELNYGQPGDPGQTYRGLMQTLEEGSKNRSMYKKWMTRPIKRINNQRFLLYKQYWIDQGKDDPQVQEWIAGILDKGGFTPENFEALQHNFTVTMKATNEDKKIRLLKAKETADFLLPDPSIQASPVAKRNLIINVLRAMGDEDPETTYPPVEQLQEEQIQIQMEAQRRVMAEQQQAQAQQEQIAQGARDDYKKKHLDAGIPVLDEGESQNNGQPNGVQNG